MLVHREGIQTNSLETDDVHPPRWRADRSALQSRGFVGKDWHVRLVAHDGAGRATVGRHMLSVLFVEAPARVYYRATARSAWAPVWVLLMDAMGLVHPPSRGNEVIFHVECPFSRWPWLKAAPVDTAEHGAKFLVEEVFFDLQGSLRCYAVTEAALSSVVSCARSTST